MEDSLLEIGKVVRPHGVHGKVRLTYYGATPQNLIAAPYVVVKQGGEALKVAVLAAEPYKKQWVVTFGTIRSVEEARVLAGARVYVEKSFLPPLPEGEFYWFDLIGCRVVTQEGKTVGTLADIIPTGSNDVYVVKHERGEVLVPATVDAIKAVDIEAKMITIFSLEDCGTSDPI